MFLPQVVTTRYSTTEEMEDIRRRLRGVFIGVVLGSGICGALMATTLIAAHAGLRKVPKLEYLRTRLMILLGFAMAGVSLILLARLLMSCGLLYM
ncbi:MAG TPA: hypothetical protein VF681_01350 [Abditibacteriaceae bacterium]|jgi:hypothetical protein